MSERPLLIDLFCCAGGASRGYHEAGFDVVGVDISPRKNYPYPVIKANALDVLTVMIIGSGTLRFGSDIGNGRRPAAIHASPPCQGYTSMRHAPGALGTAPRMIGDVRALLQKTGLPYVIENVPEAASEMQAPHMLCGTMFGLGCYDDGLWHQLWRHRLFETNWPLTVPECDHAPDAPVIGVYGGHARRRAARHGGRGTQDQWVGGHKRAASEAMGIDWMTLGELSEALPPVYTRFIGKQLLQHINKTG